MSWDTDDSGRIGGLSRLDLAVTLVLLVGLVAGLAYLLPGRLFLVVVAISSMSAVFYVSSVLITYYGQYLPEWMAVVPTYSTIAAPFTVVAVLLFWFRIDVTLLGLALLVALILVFFYYWLVVPLAFYQRLREQNTEVEIDEWPEIAVLVPAYNEQGYIGPAIESFLAADYPRDRLNIVVVDDGSTDDTFAEALAYESEQVTVLTKPNGGKHAALNYAVQATHCEYVVTVDADSVVAPDAFKRLVQSMIRTGASAVAGNVKVSNRGSLVTNLQALEYIVGINTFRRAFDLVGVVTVVPGCLGLFSRSAVAEVGSYSPDTITEDFDLTIELLARGYSVHHSDAVVYTEAPDTWRDLYKQRLRWFRGNVQTVLKHRRALADRSSGLLHQVAFPYLLFSMSVLPLLGLVILAVILVQTLSGSVSEFAGLLVLFGLLQVLLSLLAIRIEDEDLWLARYAPFSIVGYKQFLDVVLIRGIVDVLRTDELPWTGPERIRQRDELELYQQD